MSVEARARLAPIPVVIALLLTLACGPRESRPQPGPEPVGSGGAMAASGGAPSTDEGGQDPGPSEGLGGAGGADTGTPLANGFTRESLLDRRVGYGAEAGGVGDGSDDDALTWTEVVVDSLDDAGPGTLREAMSEGQRWVTFVPGLRGTIDVQTSLVIPSRVVIDGRGAAITFVIDDDPVLTTGFSGPGKDNFILTNLTFVLVPGAGESDGIQNAAGRDAWFDHLTFLGLGKDNTSDGDGSIDTTHNSSQSRHPDDITVSYCRFEGWNKTMHASFASNASEPPDADEDKSKFTLYRNLWRSNRQRQPLSRGALVDFANSWIQDWGLPGTGIAIQVNDKGEVLIRDSVFDAGPRKQVVVTATPPPLTYPGIAKDGGGNVLTNGAVITENAPADCFDPAMDYDLPLDLSGQALRDHLESMAGAQ